MTSTELLNGSTEVLSDFLSEVHPLFRSTYTGPGAQPVDRSIFKENGKIVLKNSVNMVNKRNKG